MASLVANDANPLIVEVPASPSRVAVARPMSGAVARDTFAPATTGALPAAAISAALPAAATSVALPAAATSAALPAAATSVALPAAATSVALPAAATSVALPAGSATLVRVAGLAVLCAATLVAPALLLVWMPIVLGVPHIASDIRFLVLPLPPRQIVLSLVACAALVALKAASLGFALPLLRAEMVVVAGWLLLMLALERRTRRSHALERHAQIAIPTSGLTRLPVVPAATRAERSSPRRTRRYAETRRSAAVWLFASFAAFAIIALPIQFAIFAAFAHNFVAVIAWIVVKRPARRQTLALIVTIVAAVGVLVAVGPAMATVTGGIASPWLTIDKAASVMFGGVPLPTARRLMIAFAFLQAVHYAIWLAWMPRGAARMATKPWLLVVAGTLAVVAVALVDPAWARTTYLALATFHIYLELVVLAARAARRRT
jgi:hypothetical protein